MGENPEIESSLGKTYQKLVQDESEPSSQILKLTKAEITVDGKKYEKLENVYDVGKEKELDENEDEKEVGEPEVAEKARCISCFNYAKNPMCSAMWLSLCTALMVMETVFYYWKLGRSVAYIHDGEAWVRIILAIILLLRGVFTINMVMVSGTVKRNVYYIYPGLYKHHILVVVFNVLVLMLETVVLSWGGNKWGNIAFNTANLIITLYGCIIIYHQQKNGQLSCSPREVVGDERGTYIPGGEAMEIAENNIGTIRTHIDEAMLQEFAIL